METPDRLLHLLDDDVPLTASQVEAVLARVRATVHPKRTSSGHHKWMQWGWIRWCWIRWPIAACGGLAAVLIAQQALSLFEIRKVVPLRYPVGQLPFELMLPNVFPLYPAKQVKVTHASNAAEAAAQVGYRVRTLRSALLPYPPSFQLEQYPTVERTIDRARIEAALARRNAAPIAFPKALAGGRVAIRSRGTAVVTRYGNCPHLAGPASACAFLIQQIAPLLELPAGVDAVEFTEFSLRLIGLSAADAHMLRETLPAAPSLFLPMDEAVLDVAAVKLLRGTPGTLVRYKPTMAGQAFSMQWTEGSQVFTLMGRDPSQAVAIADALEP
jgi:hypothetical protein